jgi:mannose-6-phosphate isomerase-like protein (cupin superfamily)
MSTTEQTKPGFKIYRAADAPELMESGCMSVEPFTEVQRAGMDQLVKSGYLQGGETKILCQIPGFSLAHVWFKKGYPLPLHSHDSDCLYYIIAGNIQLGTEELGPRDSFFIPGGVPYTYKPGENGVELLEFRHEPHFNFVNLANAKAFWDKAAVSVTANAADWPTAKMPVLNG